MGRTVRGINYIQTDKKNIKFVFMGQKIRLGQKKMEQDMKKQFFDLLNYHIHIMIGV